MTSILSSIFFSRLIDRKVRFFVLLFPISLVAQNPLQVQMVPQFYAGGYNISCFGGNNGRINTQVTGGVPPYTYQWSNGAISANIQNLSANTYTVTVTDANANSVSAQVDLYQPKAIVDRVHKSNYKGFNISKEGANDGDVKIEVDGGNTPYSIQWSNAQSGEYVNQLEAGTYNYTIMDMSGCVKTGNVNMTQPGPFNASVSVIQHISCRKGEKDGMAHANATGGQPPYFFKWDNGQFTDTAKYLNEGQHQVAVYDANGAEVILTVTINTPDQLKATLIPLVYPNVHNTSCADCCNGQISATVTGGTAPFTYFWSNEQNTAQLENLCEGFYNLGVIDSKGCRTESSIFLSAPKANNWNLTGNANSDPNTQFIGTTDQKDLVFKTNNAETFRLGADGKARFGQSPIINNLADANLGAFKLNIPFTTASGEFTVPSEWKIEYQPLGLRPCKKPINIAAWQFAATGEGENDYDPDKINYFGKVGINVCFPQQELHVNGTGLFDGNLITVQKTIFGALDNGNEWNGNEPTMFVNSTNNSSALYIKALGMADFATIQQIKTDNAKAKVFNVDLNDQSKFTVYGNGNVVIGGSSTGNAINNSKLMVDGLIAAKEVRVMLTDFPDYVFESDYCIDDLDQVAEYIEVNKHLPGMIPAKEVKEDSGFDLGAVQLMTIEKLEELYLHVIQLNERIKVLEKENIILKNAK